MSLEEKRSHFGQRTANRHRPRTPDSPDPGKGTPAITAGCNAYQYTDIAYQYPQVLWHLDSLSHVALIGGGHPHQPSCNRLPGKHKQEAPRSESASLRPLQAEKESVPFSGHPYCRFIQSLLYFRVFVDAVRCSFAFFVRFICWGFTLPLCRRWDPFARKVHTLYVIQQRVHLHRAYKGALPSSLENHLPVEHLVSQTRGPPKRYMIQFVLAHLILIFLKLCRQSRNALRENGGHAVTRMSR